MAAASRLAKFSVPRTSGALVRTRLHRLLDKAVQRAAVWVAAGPGSGKSTLAGSWVASRSGRVQWYRADEGDADPAVAFAFLRQLARANTRNRSLPTFSSHDLDRLDHFARTFFRAFFAITPAASTLVIDDAHVAAGDAFDAVLSAAVIEAPHDVALLILSRRDPSGPLLDQVASGALELVDGTPLAFTPDEAADLFSDRMDAAAARRLHGQAQGWAAGMLLLSQTGSAGDDRLAGIERITAYFDRRVLAQFDAGALRTLAAASLLPEVDGSQLRRLGVDDGAVELLERLRKHHAFVARLDRDPPSWRLHDLLRDALRARFDSVEDSRWRARVATAAAEVATAGGLVRDAVSLWLRAGRTDDALATAERFARWLVKEQRLGDLDAVVSALGSEVAASSLPLQVALGESAWQRNDARVALDHFERAHGLVDTPAPSATALLIAASALEAIFVGWQGYADTATWIARVREHLGARAEIDKPSDGLRIDSTCIRAMSLLWGEKLGDYATLVERVLETLRQQPAELGAEDAVAASSVLMEAAAFQLSDERLFHDTIAATSAWLLRGDLAPLVKAEWLNTYAPIGRHWPTPGVKLPAKGLTESLEVAMRLARDHGGQSLAFQAASFLVAGAVANNDRAGAVRWSTTLRELADPAQVAQTYHLLTTEASVLALKGDWKSALEAVDRAFPLVPQHSFPTADIWNISLLRHRITLASGDAARARADLLHDSGRFPEGMRRDFALILADVATAALALNERGAIPQELVERVMHRAREYSWRGFATLLAPISAQLCAEALRMGIEPDFARQVARERNLAAPSPYHPHWPWPIRIRALGGLRIVVDDAPLASGARTQRKPLDLLKAIVAHGPTPVDAAVVLDALWPDAEGAAARAAFDMAVLRLRKLLGRDDAVRLDAGHVELDRATVWVDAWAFAAGATDDYPGPLFGVDAIEPWWAAARERLHQRFLHRTLERGRALEHSGELDEALAVYEAGLAQDPLAEDLYQGAIRCHARAGRAADALRVFRRCREQLSIVLAVAPSPATVALVAGLSSR